MFTKLFRSPSSLQQFKRACTTDDTRTVARLVKADPSLVHYHDKMNQTGLSLAAERGQRYVVEQLLTYGADPNFSGTGDPADSVYHPLITACFNGHMSCVNALLKAGADPNAVSAFGTPLELLALRYKIESPEAALLLFLHSKEPLRLRSSKDMTRQHSPEDMHTIGRGMAAIHRATQHISTLANKTSGKMKVSSRKASSTNRRGASSGTVRRK